MKFLIINGPNLNLLGRREPGIYGNATFEEYLDELYAAFPDHTIDYFQSNVEGEIINALHAADGRYEGVLLNAGGYTHTSVAIADAIGAIATPVVEVHISCTLAREEFRHVSLIAPKCKGTIMGFGLDSYRLGLLSFIK
ncbi:MAG: type II 3-dehydroquinate dehydratase [Rikenellaceae bacterium]|jgi:3-dehydroquinate dehydratase-2|nr:type II 3-dehydroquinate dehydratase [Rikenellaceae bacterium]